MLQGHFNMWASGFAQAVMVVWIKVIYMWYETNTRKSLHSDRMATASNGGPACRRMIMCPFA